MNVIKQIVQLQNIDTQLQEINELLGDLPARVEELNQEKKELLEALENGKKRIQETELELARLGLHIKEVQEKRTQLKDQLFRVTNNRQYDALTQEIEFLKTDLEKSELENLELLELKEQLQDRLASQEKNLESLTKNLEQRQKNLEAKMAESAAQKSKLDTQRAKVSKSIDPAILARYQRVSEAREGLAVVPIKGNACGGCGAMVTPQIISNIRQGTGIFTCDVCSRFLYWEPS
jgi:hypothetical protein